jgi:hypothetical protein
MDPNLFWESLFREKAKGIKAGCEAAAAHAMTQPMNMTQVMQLAISELKDEGYHCMSKDDKQNAMLPGLARCKERRILRLKMPGELCAREMCVDLTWANEIEIQTTFLLKCGGLKRKVTSIEEWNQLKPELSPMWEENALFRGDFA